MGGKRKRREELYQEFYPLIDWYWTGFCLYICLFVSWAVRTSSKWTSVRGSIQCSFFYLCRLYRKIPLRFDEGYGSSPWDKCCESIGGVRAIPAKMVAKVQIVENWRTKKDYEFDCLFVWKCTLYMRWCFFFSLRGETGGIDVKKINQLMISRRMLQTDGRTIKQKGKGNHEWERSIWLI